ncbi:hypothetical protein FH972_010994 [Carpinus fangiana]|uniref:Uncharacterized protein n=1 Tax=Carpinus fangiana TaxID=176857 RepID=A0A660KRY9_9ROSI|nr:hypothetical protein FH972_010994 [Carpinus fangiana]
MPTATIIPHHWKPSFDGDDDKGKQIGSVLNSSSSTVVIEDGSNDDQEGDPGRVIKGPTNSKLFGFSFTENGSPPVVTRQFFPMDESETGATSDAGGGGGPTASSGAFPRAH